MTLTIDLPLPPRALSSNGSHGHWAWKGREARRYREECHLLARVSGGISAQCVGFEYPMQYPKRRRVSYTFGIKGARAGGYYCPRDVSNALAAFKAGQDGLVDAGILVDDSAKWMELGTVTIDATVGPFVRVTVEPCD